MHVFAQSRNLIGSVAWRGFPVTIYTTIIIIIKFNFYIYIKFNYILLILNILEFVICCIVTVSTSHGTLCLVRALIWPFESTSIKLCLCCFIVEVLFWGFFCLVCCNCSCEC